ncbi:MAG: response regulator [Planctomycetota bacterium]
MNSMNPFPPSGDSNASGQSDAQDDSRERETQDDSHQHEVAGDSKKPDADEPSVVDTLGDRPSGDAEYLLVVDDSETARHLMRSILEADGFAVETVADAESALAALHAATPIAIITDLEMPGMSGLDLVQTLRGTHPSVPVILSTAKGSEDIAASALRVGAASYVPKRDVRENLTVVVRQVLSTGEAVRSAQAVGRFATRSGIELSIGNDETLVPKVISRFEMALLELDLFDDGERMQIAMALDEALLNAIVHGNLEVPSELREVDDGVAYHDMIDQRRKQAPYKDRRVTISLDANRDQAVFVVRDMGPGYDPECLTDATDEEHIEGFGGRGMLMIDAFMDEVRLNDCGNEIVMIKRRGEADSTPLD